MIKKYTRFFSILVMTGIISAGTMWLTSCDEGDPKGTPDTDNPSVTISSPSAGAIGVSGAILAVVGTITDEAGLASVSLTLGNGTVEVISEEFTTFSDPTSFSLNENYDIPSDVVLGNHTLTIVATDLTGNEGTATVEIVALPAFEDGKVTLVVDEFPADGAGEDFHMVGDFMGDETGAGDWTVSNLDYTLAEYEDSEGTVSYFISVKDANTTVTDGSIGGFKFVRGTDWPYVEKDENGKEAVNRSVAAGTDFEFMQIGSWADYNPIVANNSGVTVFDGTGVTSVEIKGNVKDALTTESAVVSAEYSVLDATEVEVASGTLTLEAPNGSGERNYSEDLDISTFALGVYSIVVTALDGNGNQGREDKTLSIIVFPCSETGLPAVDGAKTRFIINVPVLTDDIYITGNFPGSDIWGTIDPAYELTKISDGCYYIDIAVQADKTVQFFREPIAWAVGDWWRGQATQVAGSDSGASFSTTIASNGNTVKLYFPFWRQTP